MPTVDFQPRTVANISIRPRKQVKVTVGTGGSASALDRTKVSKTGDTMTGNLTVPEINFSTATISSGQYITSDANEVIIDTFDSTLFRSAKYIFQSSSGVDYSTIEILVLHDDANVYIGKYGEIDSNVSLVSYSADLVSSNVTILATPINTNTTINFIRYSTKV